MLPTWPPTSCHYHRFITGLTEVPPAFTSKVCFPLKLIQNLPDHTQKEGFSEQAKEKITLLTKAEYTCPRSVWHSGLEGVHASLCILIEGTVWDAQSIYMRLGLM